jgi:hypothetical protein
LGGWERWILHQYLRVIGKNRGGGAHHSSPIAHHPLPVTHHPSPSPFTHRMPMSARRLSSQPQVYLEYVVEIEKRLFPSHVFVSFIQHSQKASHT